MARTAHTKAYMKKRMNVECIKMYDNRKTQCTKPMLPEPLNSTKKSGHEKFNENDEPQVKTKYAKRMRTTLFPLDVCRFVSASGFFG